jgi:glycosyltransferase involved in cell wall biosynthesis
MTLPLVSVIIPCYRQARFLPDALASVLGQKYPAVEAIVVNDGSDDDTEAVALKYGDKIKYVAKQNGGLPTARNAGIRAAGGDFLLFLDADDMLHRNAVAWQVEAMDGRTDRLCVMGYKRFQTDPEAESGVVTLPPAEPSIPGMLLFDNIAPPHCYLAPQGAIRQVGCFDESPRAWACEDWDLWVRLLLHGLNVHPVVQVGAYYRRYEGSMSTNRARMAQTHASLLKKVYDAVPRHEELLRRWAMSLTELKQKLLKSIRMWHLEAAYFYRQRGEYSASLVQYWQSIRKGSLSVTALAGMAKLLPHRLLRRWAMPNP